MKNSVVIDSSVIIALMNEEKGCEKAEEYLEKSIISSVNFEETLVVLNRAGLPIEEGREIIKHWVGEIVPFDEELSYVSASLWEQSKKHGLSLGDRACLALGIAKKLKVITADKIWQKLDLGLEIELLR